jgi:hypothetical protein
LNVHKEKSPLSWVLLEKLPFAQFLKNFPTFYKTRSFITVLTRAINWSLSCIRSIQSILSHTISLRFILILSYHLHLGHLMLSSWLSRNILICNPLLPLFYSLMTLGTFGASVTDLQKNKFSHVLFLFYKQITNTLANCGSAECLNRLNAHLSEEIYVRSSNIRGRRRFCILCVFFFCLCMFSIMLIAICGACQDLYLPKEMSQDQLILNVTWAFSDVPGHRQKGYNCRSLGSPILFAILFIRQ